jgi:hypothetical protein
MQNKLVVLGDQNYGGMVVEPWFRFAWICSNPKMLDDGCGEEEELVSG